MSGGRARRSRWAHAVGRRSVAGAGGRRGVVRRRSALLVLVPVLLAAGGAARAQTAPASGSPAAAPPAAAVPAAAVPEAAAAQAAARATSAAAASPAVETPAVALAGTDVRTLGALCDGRTDDAPALRGAYERLAADGGTIVVPAGVRCALGGDGVEPRSRVSLRCERGGGFVAMPGARALFRTTATLDDWSVTGCDLDLNGVAAVAWESSGGQYGGSRWEFRDNTVRGMPPGDGAPTSLVRLDCTLASGPCVIANNTIFGSGSAARRDTCLTVGAGGFIGFNTQVLGNYVQDCGGDCLEIRGPGGVTVGDNSLVRCFDNAADNSSLNSVWTGNQLSTAGAGAGAVLSIHDTIGNQVIVGNQLNKNSRTTAPAVHAIAKPGTHLTGIYLDSNYAAQGVFFDARGRCDGGTCDGASCDDDGGCGACGGRCIDYGLFDHDHVANLIVTDEIRMENATNLVVQGNVIIGTASDGPSSAVRLVNPRGDRPNGGIVVADNQIGKRTSLKSSLACIELDDAGGGGFAGVNLTGNVCGEDPASTPYKWGARPIGVRLTRPPRTWRSIVIADNNFGATRPALAGFSSPELRAATRMSGNLGLGAGDAQPVVESFVAATALDAFAAVAPAAAADLAVEPARPGSAPLGCALADTTDGATVPVAVAGIAECTTLAPIARGDALAAATEPGRLHKAAPGEPILGRALESADATRPLRVLIQPAAPGH